MSKDVGIRFGLPFAPDVVDGDAGKLLMHGGLGQEFPYEKDENILTTIPYATNFVAVIHLLRMKLPYPEFWYGGIIFVMVMTGADAGGIFTTSGDDAPGMPW